MKLLVLCCFLFIPVCARSQTVVRDTAVHPVMQIFRLVPLSLKAGQTIPSNFYTQCFGFFCKQELKLQQAHVPVTFRLGSMDYCNYLEQKPGYR
jgi:hypothetical protein